MIKCRKANIQETILKLSYKWAINCNTVKNSTIQTIVIHGLHVAFLPAMFWDKIHAFSIELSNLTKLENLVFFLIFYNQSLILINFATKLTTPYFSQY